MIGGWFRNKCTSVNLAACRGFGGSALIKIQ
jgi:hypothetical protein